MWQDASWIAGGFALLLKFVEYAVEGYAVRRELDNRAEIGGEETSRSEGGGRNEDLLLCCMRMRAKL